MYIYIYICTYIYVHILDTGSKIQKMWHGVLRLNVMRQRISLSNPIRMLKSKNGAFVIKTE